MLTEFYSLQLNKHEALECLRALLLQAIVDDEVRTQKGLELPELSTLITRLTQILRINEQGLEVETDKAGDELWEYSWFVFTNEWAWYRAQQDALKLKSKKSKIAGLKQAEINASAEKLFTKFFDRYVAELNMKPLPSGGLKKPSGKRKKD